MSVRVNSSLRSLRVEIREVIMEAAILYTVDYVTVLLSAVPYFDEQVDVNVDFLLSIL